MKHGLNKGGMPLSLKACGDLNKNGFRCAFFLQSSKTKAFED